jgi:hypothetical protein
MEPGPCAIFVDACSLHLEETHIFVGYQTAKTYVSEYFLLLFGVFWSKMRGLQTCQQFEVLSRQGHRVKQLRMGSQKTTDTFI